MPEPGQGLPQAPQLAGSIVRSRQWPSQQMPPWGQLLPQAPQFLASWLKPQGFRQDPSQATRLGGQLLPDRPDSRGAGSAASDATEPAWADTCTLLAGNLANDFVNASKRIASM